MTATSHEPIEQQSGRDPGLWHVCFKDEYVGLCGSRLAGADVPYDTVVDGGACADLAGQRVAGTWTP